MANKIESLSENNQKPKRAGGMSQVVERLPRKGKGLGSKASTTKKTNQKMYIPYSFFSSVAITNY
jgi:hypothetical protein